MHPGIGLWSMPGGYVDRGEVVEEAGVREVLEETGLEVEVDQLVGLFSERGHPVIVAAFAAREVGGVLKAGLEALDVGFFSPDDYRPSPSPGTYLFSPGGTACDSRNEGDAYETS